jgi:single-strand DNA-binding protein
MSVANITITGRLARDPETSTTPSGVSLCKLTIPVDNKRKDTTTWWTVTLFGKSGEAAARYLRKSSWVCVAGEAHVSTYNKRDGSTGVAAEVENARFSFVGPKQDAGDDSRGNSGGGTSYKADPDLTDVPF